MKLKRLSESDFDRVARLTGMEQQTLDMVRDVLVVGMPRPEVSLKYGITKQRIFSAVSTIEQAYFNSEGDGSALVSLDLLLPERLALELASISKILESRPMSDRDSEIIEETLSALTRARQALEQ